MTQLHSINKYQAQRPRKHKNTNNTNLAKTVKTRVGLLAECQ